MEQVECFLMEYSLRSVFLLLNLARLIVVRGLCPYLIYREPIQHRGVLNVIGSDAESLSAESILRCGGVKGLQLLMFVPIRVSL